MIWNSRTAAFQWKLQHVPNDMNLKKNYEIMTPKICLQLENQSECRCEEADNACLWLRITNVINSDSFLLFSAMFKRLKELSC